jgi:hypothetical protein
MSALEIIGWDHQTAYRGLDAKLIAELLSGNTDLTRDEIDDIIEQLQRRGSVSIPLAHLYNPHFISCVKQTLESVGALVELRS